MMMHVAVMDHTFRFTSRLRTHEEIGGEGRYVVKISCVCKYPYSILGRKKGKLYYILLQYAYSIIIIYTATQIECKYRTVDCTSSCVFDFLAFVRRSSK